VKTEEGLSSKQRTMRIITSGIAEREQAGTRLRIRLRLAWKWRTSYTARMKGAACENNL